MKSGLEPLIEFFTSTIAEHLGKLLKQRIEALHLVLMLTDK